MKDSKQAVRLRKKRNYFRVKLFLHDKLGSRCIKCGCNELSKLEFDIKVPDGKQKNGKAVHHSMASYNRMCFYKRQYEINNLQILCVSCNTRKGNALALTNLVETPF